MSEVQFVGMASSHRAQFTRHGDTSRIRMVVLHSTAGRFPGDYEWLRIGGYDHAPVSVHYYIRKDGWTVQMVPDAHIAWHAGQSTWEVDGREIAYATGCNPVSVGIELENLNDGLDIYPSVQIEAAIALTRTLVQRYNVPQAQVVRHLDIAPGRKTDPAGFPWEQFLFQVFSAQPRADVPDPGTYVLRWPATVRTSPEVLPGNVHPDSPFSAGAWIDIAGWETHDHVRNSALWGRLASPEYEDCWIHISAFLHSGRLERR